MSGRRSEKRTWVERRYYVSNLERRKEKLEVIPRAACEDSLVPSEPSSDQRLRDSKPTRGPELEGDRGLISKFIQAWTYKTTLLGSLAARGRGAYTKNPPKRGGAHRSGCQTNVNAEDIKEITLSSKGGGPNDTKRNCK